MAARKQMANENEFLVAVESGAPKTNLGGGLYLRIHNYTHKYFQFRICLGGKDTTKQLGTYPEMTYEQARGLAEKCRNEVRNSRQKKASSTFSEKLIELSKGKKHEEIPCFENLQDAGTFIIKLKNTIDNSYYTGNVPMVNSKDSDTLIEIYSFIWLQLLMPMRTNELLHAHGKEFDVKNLTWRIELKSKEIGYSQENLSNSFMKIIKKLGILNLNSNLFKNLSKLNKTDRNKKIENALKEIGPGYAINPNKFKLFFEFIANKYSGFNSKLIKNVAANQGSKSYWDFNYQQRWALVDWWETQLNRGEHLFNPESSEGYTEKWR
jgi:Arm DNA-binding domain